MKLTYRSPMKDKYLEVGKIDCGGYDLASLIDADDFASSGACTFKHGSDGGGLQQEIDEIGEKLVLAFNCHDEAIGACEVARDVIKALLRALPPQRLNENLAKDVGAASEQIDNVLAKARGEQ